MEKKKWSLLVVVALLVGLVGFLSSRTSFADSRNGAADAEAVLPTVTITCQAGNPPVINLFPNPINVVAGAMVDWVISGSCIGVFNTITVVVPGLNYNSGAIAPPGVTPATPAIPAGNHNYTVNGAAPNRSVATDGMIVATNPIPNPIPITFQDAAGNPYCDGMSLNHQLPGGYAISGSFCGCLTEAVQGNFVGQANPIVPTGTGALVFTPSLQIFTKIKFNPRSWAHYFYSDPANPFNSGTFAYGCPVMEGGVSSFGD